MLVGISHCIAICGQIGHKTYEVLHIILDLIVLQRSSTVWVAWADSNVPSFFILAWNQRSSGIVSAFNLWPYLNSTSLLDRISTSSFLCWIPLVQLARNHYLNEAKNLIKIRMTTEKTLLFWSHPLPGGKNRNGCHVHSRTSTATKASATRASVSPLFGWISGTNFLGRMWSGSDILRMVLPVHRVITISLLFKALRFGKTYRFPCGNIGHWKVTPPPICYKIWFYIHSDVFMSMA